ncbi:DNA-processing protein DprA [Salinibacterium sp. ZJ70]|uniref:DNA-processing protein DprA n=1 Tax=Salinibacterium sp. ZJ70 TaxID=2708084 RepID=UPI00141F17C4|nr:DNA-processing protein DprA [Salinibacterium sp. ZJ70]
MSILGIADSTVASLVRPITSDVHDRDAIAVRFARGIWTSVAEPGDRIARIVVDALGAEEALGHLIDDRDGELLRHALADAGVELDDDDLVEAVKRWTPRISKADALLAFRQAARFGLSLVVPDDPEWPAGFDDLGDHAPNALWVRGDRAALAALDRSIAIVGARAATGYGEHVAVEASAGLVDRGYVIVSGAAYGIDGAAHRAALASRGTTLAFLAGGLDRFYPSGHDGLLTRIVETGAAISEVPCGAAPTKWRFLQRNRLIAAASRATIVVEAGARSGSLNTAGHAAALGRPLGAVPGPVTSSASAGCHRLLREYDAVCVTTADEMAELAPLEPGAAIRDAPDTGGGRASGGGASDPTGARIRLLDAMSTRSARTPEKIAALAGLAIDRVRAELGHLELEGIVRSRAGEWVRVST